MDARTKRGILAGLGVCCLAPLHARGEQLSVELAPLSCPHLPELEQRIGTACRPPLQSAPEATLVIVGETPTSLRVSYRSTPAEESIERTISVAPSDCRKLAQVLSHLVENWRANPLSDELPDEPEGPKSREVSASPFAVAAQGGVLLRHGQGAPTGALTLQWNLSRRLSLGLSGTLAGTLTDQSERASYLSLALPVGLTLLPPRSVGLELSAGPALEKADLEKTPTRYRWGLDAHLRLRLPMTDDWSTTLTAGPSWRPNDRESPLRLLVLLGLSVPE